jgi:hypothetical protein
MERIVVLREQAALLRTLAFSFDIQEIQDQLLDLAARCDELAKSMEERRQGADLRPDELPPDLH